MEESSAFVLNAPKGAVLRRVLSPLPCTHQSSTGGLKYAKLCGAHSGDVRQGAERPKLHPCMETLLRPPTHTTTF